MESPATIFDTGIDRLVDSLAGSLAGAVPAGALRGLGDEELLVATGAIERLGRLVDARRVEVAGELQHRSRPALGSASLAVTRGCRDAVELLRRLTGTATATARRRLRLGGETRPQATLSGEAFPARFPRIAAALEDGTLGVDAATAIVSELAPTRIRADATGIGAAEAELVGAATGTGHAGPIPATADEIRDQAMIWRTYLDQDGILPAEEQAMGRRAFSPGSYNSTDGLVHGHYALMPEIHAKLGRIFDACLTPKTAPAFPPQPGDPDSTDPGATAGTTGANDAETGTETGTEGSGSADVSPEPVAGPVDPRSPDQQRHDIIAAMIDGFARSGTTPTIGGAAPTVLVTVRAEDLSRGTGAGFVSLGGTTGPTIPLSLRTITQLICTGGTQTITLTPGGTITNIGTEQRCFTPTQRKAITARDGGCIIPGCTIPAASTEIHHVTPDAAGGPTHTNNGVLLCWFHHRTIATSGWHIRMINGTPHIKAPPWLHGDGLWHPTTKSPTRQTDTIQHTAEQHQSTNPPPSPAPPDWSQPDRPQPDTAPPG